MTREELKRRTKDFALRIVRLTGTLSEQRSTRVIANQLLRSGTGMAANYRAALRARTRAEFISKLRLVEEEADESLFWLEILIESGIVPKDRIAALRQEADELTAIFTASGKTMRGSPNPAKNTPPVAQKDDRLPEHSRPPGKY